MLKKMYQEENKTKHNKGNLVRREKRNKNTIKKQKPQLRNKHTIKHPKTGQ